MDIVTGSPSDLRPICCESWLSVLSTLEPNFVSENTESIFINACEVDPMSSSVAVEPVVKVERDGHVLVLTLNIPEKLNPITPEVQSRLESLFTEAKADPGVRALVLTGAGRGFCSGADTGRLENRAQTKASEQFEEGLAKFTPRMAELYKPTICAVNGVCAGGGLHFVSDCSIVICSESATFLDTHVSVGQVTAMEPIGLSRRIPLESVFRMVVLGRHERISAQRALQLNMVSEVLPPDQLMPRALELARMAASASPAAMSKSLQAIWKSLDMPLSEAEKMAFEVVINHRTHPDALEGPVAFREKRNPVWRDD